MNQQTTTQTKIMATPTISSRQHHRREGYSSGRPGLLRLLFRSINGGLNVLALLGLGGLLSSFGNWRPPDPARRCARETGGEPEHRGRNDEVRPLVEAASIGKGRPQRRFGRELHDRVVLAGVARQEQQRQALEESRGEVHGGSEPAPRDEVVVAVHGAGEDAARDEDDHAHDERHYGECLRRLPRGINLLVIGVAVACFEDPQAIDIHSGGEGLVPPDCFVECR